MRFLKEAITWGLSAMLLISAVGCGGESGGTMNQAEQTVPETESSWYSPSDTDGFVWQDNTVDAYVCVSRTVLPVENAGKLDEFFMGGEMLSKTMWGRLCHYREKDADRLAGMILYMVDATDEVKGFPITSMDESISSKVFMKVGTTVDGMGCVLATNNFAQDGSRNCEIVVLDGEGNLIVPVVTAQDASLWDSYERNDSFIADAQGNIYFTGRYTEGETKSALLVLDKEGKLIFERKGYDWLSLQVLPDGRIAACVREKAGSGILIQLRNVDIVSGEEEVLAEWRGDDEGSVPLCVTLLDAGTLLYVNNRGLYSCKTDGNNQNLLYEWSNHGISINTRANVQMTVDDEQLVRVLYYENEPYRENPQIPVLLCLCPTTEKRQMQEIDFAIPSGKEEEYRKAVTDFYKLYPNCKVNLVTYEDESRLLTELIAGKGPVLVDTGLVSFEENEELWECLDKRLAKSSLNGVFLDKLLDAGRIAGKQYGLVSEWQMLTYASTADGVMNWNQETFLEYLRVHPEVTSLYADQSPINFISFFFCPKLNDSMFIDEAAGKAFFDTEKFVELLEMAKKLAAETTDSSQGEDIAKMREGSRLGTWAYLFSPASLAYYEAIMGEKADFTGFPGRNESRHYIMASDPVAIRATAQEWEKQAAMAFLEVLFSYDTQKMIEAGDTVLSARRDIFAEQMDALEDTVTYGVDGENVTMPVDIGKVKEDFLALYQKAVIYSQSDSGLADFLNEELSGYFAGEKTAEEAADALQNRVQLYLDEQ